MPLISCDVFVNVSIRRAFTGAIVAGAAILMKLQQIYLTTLFLIPLRREFYDLSHL